MPKSLALQWLQIPPSPTTEGTSIRGINRDSVVPREAEAAFLTLQDSLKTARKDSSLLPFCYHNVRI